MAMGCRFFFEVAILAPFIDLDLRNVASLNGAVRVLVDACHHHFCLFTRQLFFFHVAPRRFHPA